MSGCRFYVDAISGSNDIVVFHANTKNYGSGPGSPANSQDNRASQELDRLHSAAITDYTRQNPNVMLMPRAFLRKYDYMMPREAEILRKRNQGRKNLVTKTGYVEKLGTFENWKETAPLAFHGGTTVLGEFDGQSWNFYYQTFGRIEYVRASGPLQAAKLLATFQLKTLSNVVRKGNENNVHTSDNKVLDNRKFY